MNCDIDCESRVFDENLDAYVKGFKVITNQGGTSSGKTYNILQLLYTIALKSKTKLLISIVSESMPHLKKGAMRDFFNIIEVVYNEKNHNKTDGVYRVNNSVIEFFSADSSAKVRGPRRDILYINECNNLPYETYFQLLIRTKGSVFLDYNPVSEFWVHKKGVVNADDSKFIKSTYLDNKHLSASIQRSIESRKHDENWWRVYGMGEVGSIEGLIFKKFKIVDKISQSNWTVYGLDFGFSVDPSSLIRVSMSDGEIYLEELIYEKGLTSDDLSSKFKQLGLVSTDEIYADSADPKTIAELYSRRWNIRGAKKGPDSVRSGIDLMLGFKINITKNSVNLIREFRNYQWIKNKDGDELPKPIDFDNHAIDASRYAMTMKLTNTRSRITKRVLI